MSASNNIHDSETLMAKSKKWMLWSARHRAKEVDEMEVISRGITLIAGAFSTLMLILSIRKMRQETRLSRLAPIVAMGTTLLTTAVYLVINGAPVNGLLAGLLLVLGFAIGLGEGQMTRLYYRGKTLIGKRSVGYLILWGLAYLATMLLAQLGNAALHAVGILTMLFGLGTAMASNLVLLLKQMSARPAPAVALPSVVPDSGPRPSTLREDRASIKLSRPTDLPR
jgi:hypothetical protein